MEKFDRLTGIAAPLLEDNIDTDAIIPTAWMITVGGDWGNGLFGNRRRDRAGAEIQSFVLNQPRYRGSRILVAGRNFGCGSSREEAVWALVGYGIRCVIAPSFSDIFYDNAFKNGLLPVVLSAPEVTMLARDLAAAPTSQVVVDLTRCRLTTPSNLELEFNLDEGRRRPLLAGQDEVGRTLARAALIDRFQAEDRQRRPWIYRTHE
jgi:3-isopropylmalate/(R)-2-methylmalate dehydratase small subunit